VPFCRHRCGYCNFSLVAGRDDLIADFLRAIELEMSQLEKPHEIDTLFVGGGTPSHLPPANLEKLFQSLRRWFSLATGYEFTIEANPADVTPDLIDLIAAAGVNRISLGAQSFNTDKLRLLERDHGGVEIDQAVELAARAKLNVSLDLIFGVPSESPAVWQKDLESVVRLHPKHLSTYALTFERGTTFWTRRYHGELQPPTEDSAAELYEMTIDSLAGAGYEHYEVSNFALPGHACRHNVAYWNGATYFAFGPGAASHVDGCRRVNHRSTTTYLRRVLSDESPVADQETLTPRASAVERLVFGLRQRAGVDCERFARETGFIVQQLAGTTLERMIKHGLLQQDNSAIRVTHAGLMVCDSIAAELLGGSVSTS
jgi:oxygen-independent coproporphyrinogen-3 oxidase